MGESKRRGSDRGALPLRSIVKCSDRLSAEIIFDGKGLRALWTPPPPFPFKVTEEEIAAYRRARNDLAQEYARAAGGSVLMLEPDGDGKKTTADAITAEGVHHIGKGSF
jgi:hypothetical protein